MKFYNPVELNAEYLLIEGGKYKYSVTGEEIAVPDVYFAKYPVTNKLYRRFIETLPDEKRDEFRSSYHEDKRFNGDDQPVVGVTWFAAKAYCEWLNENSAAGMNFRLPAEQEWEWAASGGVRKYSWGNEKPDETRANYAKKVGHTTIVSAYPAGATPEGLMDMSGNVWEWQENWYDKDEFARGLRGGSWDLLTDYLPCALRGRDYPDDRDFYVGFRVVRAQS